MARRTGEPDPADAALLVRAFEADWTGTPGPPRFAIVGASEEVLERAAGLAGRYGLRAHDAVHLASALALAAVDPPSSTFVAFDHGLRQAAAAERLSTPQPG